MSQGKKSKRETDRQTDMCNPTDAIASKNQPRYERCNSQPAPASGTENEETFLLNLNQFCIWIFSKQSLVRFYLKISIIFQRGESMNDTVNCFSLRMSLEMKI